MDVCATPENAKCTEYYTKADDGTGKNVEGLLLDEPAQSGATVVCLVPARTDTGWWHDYAMRGEVRFVRGRLRFNGLNCNAPFPSAVVIFRGRAD